jgi:hypothetical protein
MLRLSGHDKFEEKLLRKLTETTPTTLVDAIIAINETPGLAFPALLATV